MDENENKFKDFWEKYAGAIIGAVVSIVLILIGLSRFLINIAIVIVFAFAGNYVQKNKVSLKEKVKAFVDKL